MTKAKLGLVWLIIVAGILVVQVMGNDESESKKPEVSNSGSDQPVGSVSDHPSRNKEENTTEVAEAPANRRLGKHHSDESMAGGGVIIGGLVTAIFAAVFCYIRVTRRRNDAVR
ncbi:uncharacterized protein LOC125421924 [Ziziphus jujuba]|uniref:Uncharacterized protein LOC125421924 n=1 Tax=Ziziphus jujuba TaxID=326968 RepID=A0ABM3IGS7_ZIZJJ|nr:uncharacterized protein LOC125421924 [Ziziphus jujuba]